MKVNWSKLWVAAFTMFAALSAGPAAADDYNPPKVYSMTPTGVNLSDGAFTFTQTDLSIGTLSLERFHLGGLRDPNTRFFGPRMSHNFDIYVAQNVRAPVYPYLPSRYAPIVHIGNSSVGVYSQDRTTNAPVYYSNLDSYSAILTMVSGAYIFTAHDGTVYTFNPSVGAAGNASAQRVASIAYPDGRVRSFSYNSGGQLKEVSDSNGYALIFDYNSSGLVSAACGFDLSQTYVTASSTCSGAALMTSYGYTSGHLTSVTDVLGQVTTYSYSTDVITCVKPPGYSTCKIANTYSPYSYPWQVTQQTLADGSVWTYSSTGNAANARAPDASPGDDPTSGTTVTDPAGKLSGYGFSKSSPYSATDPNGHTTQYRFTGGYESEWTLYPDIPTMAAEGSLMIEADFPEGNQYLAEYNGPFNSLTKETWVSKTPGTPANRVVQTGYSCASGTLDPTCTKPVTHTDPNGNVTNYAYTSWGGLQSEMQPAPTSGAARPLKLYDYVQKYAYVKNSSGTLVAAATPIWVANSETDCQTVAGSSTATCDTGAQITVTTYEYGANGTVDNLLVRGKVVTSGGVSLRTCYGYDAQNNKIWETSPRAGLAMCS